MTKKLKSGTPFVYDENDRVVGIRDPHTGTDTDLVTATRGPGWGIEFRAGKRRAPIFRPGVNQLVRQWPVEWATTADRDGVPKYSAVSTAGGGTWDVTLDRSCPITGLPMLECTLPSGASLQTQQVKWVDQPLLEMGPDDSWLIPVYIPLSATAPVRVTVRISSEPDVLGTEYRQINFDGAMVIPGWNILQCLHNEVKITSVQYGTVGTTYNNDWTNPGTLTTVSTPIRSIALRIAATSAPSAPLPVYVGSVHYARRGWLRSAVMWSADDVPKSFYELALPILDEFGFGFTGNYVPSYTAEHRDIYMTWPQVLDTIKRGHEAWGHTRRHDRMTEGTEAEKIRALREPRDYFAKRGMPTAAACFAYPFGAFDQQSTDIAKSLGYRLARATHGIAMSPLMPGANPYWLPALSIEQTNSWWIDSVLNGIVKRGQACVSYSHNVYPGGAGIDTRPAETSFYADHLRRWCELLAPHVESGDVVCPTMTEYFGLVGIDPLRDPLPEV